MKTAGSCGSRTARLSTRAVDALRTLRAGESVPARSRCCKSRQARLGPPEAPCGVARPKPARSEARSGVPADRRSFNVVEVAAMSDQWEHARASARHAPARCRPRRDVGVGVGGQGGGTRGAAALCHETEASFAAAQGCPGTSFASSEASFLRVPGPPYPGIIPR